MSRVIIFLFLFHIIIKSGLGQLHQEIAHKYALRHIPTFCDFLSISSDAHIPADLIKNKTWIESQFTKRGFSLKDLPTSSFPLLLAERKCAEPNAKTVLIYLQIDGQPVIPSEWQQEDPWKPVLKKQNSDGTWTQIPIESAKDAFDPNWRIFARAAADAKGPDVMFLAALDAAEELKISPNYHMKVIMDFEEELGSPQMNTAVIKYKEELMADRFIIFDGPPHISNQPTLNFGARGIAVFTLTTYGPKVNSHSGNYGNYVPNPALRMAKLLAGMKDEQGRVIIPGFYDGIKISESRKKEFSAVPDVPKDINKKLGIAKPEGLSQSFQEAMAYPTLNIRGLKSGEVLEKANTIIPNRAIAEIDVRLPLETRAEKVVDQLKKYIQSKGYTLIDGEPTDAQRESIEKLCTFKYDINYRAFRTALDSKTGIWLSKAFQKAHGKAPIKIPTVGGSIPISPFVINLGIEAVAVPTVNPDNNQHSPNENLRLGNFEDGIRTMIAILAERI